MILGFDIGGTKCAVITATVNGRFYTGTNDNAGEAGHIRLERFGPVGYGKAARLL